MNIRDDLKTFYVGNRQGTAIYVGSTLSGLVIFALQ